MDEEDDENVYNESANLIASNTKFAVKFIFHAAQPWVSKGKGQEKIEVLSARPTTLEEAFSLARITESCFEAIAHKEKATAKKEQSINETAYSITSLQSKVASLDAKRSLDANEEIKETHTRVHELEKQVEKLPMEL
ncbi:hypothetical protein Tco_0662247 [Tanacetum coccineum]